jgi:hypothetical protein
VVRPPLSVHQWLDNRQTEAERSIPFVGRVTGDTFKFHRVITGRNSFLPIVTGRIVAGTAGTELRMVLRIALPVVVFELAWLGTLTSAFLTGGGEPITFALMGLFMVVMTVGSFIQEKRRTLRALQEAFPGAVLCKDAVR